MRAVVPALPDGLVQRLRERVPDYFPETRKVGQIRLLRTHHRPYSDIYRLSIDSDSIRAREVIVKVSRDADVQFRAMMAVWPDFSVHPTLKIPRPLDYLEEGPALVMEAVSGTTLQARLPWLGWGGGRLRAAEEDCRRAGQWLRFYHDLGRTDEPAPLDVDFKWNGLEESLEELAEAGFDPRLGQRLTERLRPVAERLHHQPLQISHVHGDFKADNLLIDDVKVTALDLEAQYQNAIDHDVASFLNSLLLQRLTRPVSWQAICRLRQAFLEGYFGREHYDGSAIEFLQGFELLCVVLEIVSRRRSAVFRAWIERFLAEMIEALPSNAGGAGS